MPVFRVGYQYKGATAPSLIVGVQTVVADDEADARFKLTGLEHLKNATALRITSVKRHLYDN